MKYAVLDNDTGEAASVLTVAVAERALTSGWIKIIGNNVVVKGDIYNPVTQTFSTPAVEAPPSVPLFPIADLVITDALDAPVLFANGAYQPDKNQPFAITANVVNGEGAVQTAFNATGLKVVFIRTVANQLTQDQHLLKCSIIDGVLTINGAFDVSGVWRLDVAYNNRVLQALGFGFGIDHADIEFWV